MRHFVRKDGFCFFRRALSGNRHQLRKIVKITYALLDKLNLSLHPDKTFIGKIERGFDFLGYHFMPSGLAIARLTLERAEAKAKQQNAHGANIKRLVLFWERFLRWANAAVPLTVTLERLIGVESG